MHCFVVFDGAIDPSGKKLKTIKKRAEEGFETVHELSTSGDIDSLVSFPLLFSKPLGIIAYHLLFVTGESSQFHMGAFDRKISQ